MTELLDPHNLPFAVALGLLVLLALAQLAGAGDLLGDVDADIDLDGDGNVGLGDSLTGALGLGRLPLLVWFSLLLAVFALLGLTGQRLIATVGGGPLPPLPAGGLALLGALPLTGFLARPLARVLPHDETSAVPIDSLVGRRGRIAIGRATRGSPARVTVADVHGHPHHVMAEPNDPADSLSEGEEVLLTSREGDLFQAVRLVPNPPITVD